MKIFFHDWFNQSVHECYLEKFERTHDKLDADIIYTGPSELICYNLPKLKYVVSPCTNTDHVKGFDNIISLKNEPEFMKEITSAAEHAFCLLLMLARKQFHKLPNRYEYIGTKLKHKSIGIIGMGRIGLQIAEMAKGFQMIVIGNDIDQSKTMCGINHLLENCHFVVLCASVKSGEPPILGEDDFKRMRDGSYFINISRPYAIDEMALLRNHRKFAGIGLDVCEKQVEFTNLQNCIVTPHIGGCTDEDLLHTSHFCYRKLMKCLDQ